MTTTAAKWQRDRRERQKAAGLAPVTVYVYPEARENLRRYVKRLNERTQNPNVRANRANAGAIGA